MTGPLLILNRGGTLHGPWAWRNEPNPTWAEVLATNPRRFPDRIDAEFDLPARDRPPASAPRVLTYRVIAAVAALHALTPEPRVATYLGDGRWHLGREHRQPAAIFEQETGQEWRFDKTTSISLPATYRANGRSSTAK
ncbi:hypothetical protein [Georgenia thermotolerans]|uniref:T3SS peptide-binding chaperone domain-containing protein n=1 Tax=Georgenia thermotolerans TaxID=527326 RepID=A0A7J5UTH8_9MICO|nr:hypothetical protein [Georgenia thermotolerans]KAE8765593.1 hypothetical protein GB883_02790 [Georgenia thermotolerans]